MHAATHEAGVRGSLQCHCAGRHELRAVRGVEQDNLGSVVPRRREESGGPVAGIEPRARRGVALQWASAAICFIRPRRLVVVDDFIYDHPARVAAGNVRRFGFLQRHAFASVGQAAPVGAQQREFAFGESVTVEEGLTVRGVFGVERDEHDAFVRAEDDPRRERIRDAAVHPPCLAPVRVPGQGLRRPQWNRRRRRVAQFEELERGAIGYRVIHDLVDDDMRGGQRVGRARGGRQLEPGVGSVGIAPLGHARLLPPEVYAVDDAVGRRARQVREEDALARLVQAEPAVLRRVEMVDLREGDPLTRGQ